MSETTKLVEILKDNNQDHEYYPTTKEMIYPIYRYYMSHLQHKTTTNKLDIGAGTCNFQKYFNEFCTEEYHKIKSLQVIEKSSILIERLPKDTIVIGTDFDATTLHDKSIDLIFCNPPYSEYVNWTCRILHETIADNVFMVIPKRWNENSEIMAIIDKMNVTYEILGSFDFLEADRRARAYVDVIVFKKDAYKKHTAFDEWFENEFDSAEKVDTEKAESDIKNEIELAENKIEFLVKNYDRELSVLNSNFKAVCSLDETVLQTIGVDKRKVKDSLRLNLSSLKNKYWNYLFNQLEEVRTKLTSTYRTELKDKFTKANSVDFTYPNIYSTVLWILKNANSYCDVQVTDLYEKLSDFKNANPYKSNTNFFDGEKQRWNSWHNSKNTHYTLDYRIVCSRLSFGFGYYTSDWQREEKQKDQLDDICVVAQNLGFLTGTREYAKETGVKYYVYLPDGSVLFEYKIFQNGNTHIKMSLEFSKAFNVEASRLLGWIKNKEDVKKEFNHIHLKGCEKYFKANLQLPLNGQLLLN